MRRITLSGDSVHYFLYRMGDLVCYGFVVACVFEAE